MAESIIKPLPVVLHPHQVLGQHARPVTGVDDSVRMMLAQMTATMYGADGVGLAANQVGFLHRLVVLDVGELKKDGKRDFSQRRTRQLVNPEIVAESEERITWQEGCLSLPGLYADVERAAEVRVKYLDEHGVEQVVEADGLLSVCLQHEIDHLDGVLFPQRMSKLRRDMAEKKFAKKRVEWLEEPAYDVLTSERGLVSGQPHRTEKL